jgi:hypothetical protein
VRRAHVAAAILTLALGRSPRAAAAEVAARVCWSATPQPGPGALDPFRPPDQKAVELNAAAKAPYRQGKWDEARTQYRAAQAIDPEFLAPRLNVACSFVRQERFAAAKTEVLALLDRAYVPWAREILEAADLGALKVRPEGKEIQRAMADAAARWGADLDQDLLFVARQRPPLRVPPDGAGVFILNPHQEAWAFSPRTQRYRQLTTEDGHVLALARSPDGRRIAYVTAEKLVRGARAEDVALRGVAIHQLDLTSMAGGAAARVEGDVRRLEILASAGTFVFKMEGSKVSGLHGLSPAGALTPWPRQAKPGASLAILTARGTDTPRLLRIGGACPLVIKQTSGEGGVPVLMVAPPNKPAVALKSRDGAGLTGLALP